MDRMVDPLVRTKAWSTTAKVATMRENRGFPGTAAKAGPGPSCPLAFGDNIGCLDMLKTPGAPPGGP